MCQDTIIEGNIESLTKSPSNNAKTSCEERIGYVEYY